MNEGIVEGRRHLWQVLSYINQSLSSKVITKIEGDMIMYGWEMQELIFNHYDPIMTCSSPSPEQLILSAPS